MNYERNKIDEIEGAGSPSRKINGKRHGHKVEGAKKIIKISGKPAF
jgi:hypothetical protein